MNDFNISSNLFFTNRIQINTETRERQLRAWKDLILSYCAAQRSFILDPHTFPYFRNDAIQRSLNPNSVMQVVQYLISQGHAEWEDQLAQSRLRILWKSVPVLSQEIYSWISAQGISSNSIFTIYELHASDDFAEASFHQVDVQLIRRALALLAEQGKCVLIPGTTPDEDGVKFIAVR